MSNIIGTTNVAVANCILIFFNNALLNPRVLKGYNYFVLSNDLDDIKDSRPFITMETFTGYLDE